MYATVLEGYSVTEQTEDFEWNDKTEKKLKEQGFLHLPNNTLLIQNHDIIEEIVQSCRLTDACSQKFLQPVTSNQQPATIILDPQLGFNDLCNKEIKAV